MVYEEPRALKRGVGPDRSAVFAHKVSSLKECKTNSSPNTQILCECIRPDEHESMNPWALAGTPRGGCRRSGSKVQTHDLWFEIRKYVRDPAAKIINFWSFFGRMVQRICFDICFPFVTPKKRDETFDLKIWAN